MAGGYMKRKHAHTPTPTYTCIQREKDTFTQPSTHQHTGSDVANLPEKPTGPKVILNAPRHRVVRPEVQRQAQANHDGVGVVIRQRVLLGPCEGRAMRDWYGSRAPPKASVVSH